MCVAHHDQVDQGHGVEADAPQPHDAEHVDQDHGDGEAHQHGGPQLQAQQHRGHHQDGGQRHAQVQRRVVGDGQVLLVEHVEDAAQGRRETKGETERWGGRETERGKERNKVRHRERGRERERQRERERN